MTTTRQMQIVTRPLSDELEPWFDGTEDDFDMEAICTEYADAIEARLAELPGFDSFVWGADYEASLWVDAYADEGDLAAIRETFGTATLSAEEGGVDLETIARKHAK